MQKPNFSHLDITSSSSSLSVGIKNNLKQLIEQLEQLELENQVEYLPVKISPGWERCVIGHIRHFGLQTVWGWAEQSLTKRSPEKYFMTILRRQRA